LVALPPIPLVRQRLRSTVKDFGVSQPGRRAAALAAEHVEEFADDVAALTVIESWFEQREAS
jgi:hypothetical protein